ncbi:hypothetical protein VTO73DRAFT_6973 [Trametes versicolor]
MTALFQNSYYVLNNINAILYGIELVMCFMIVRHVAGNRQRTRADKLLIAFSTVLLVLNTIYYTTQTYFGQQMWIVHADYPGGMDAYLAANVAVWYQTWGTATVTVSNLMADALMMYRVYVIWDNASVVVIPALIWLGSFRVSIHDFLYHLTSRSLATGSGIGLLIESGRPDGNYYAGTATKFVTAWNALIISFNVITTSLICGRILYIGRQSALPFTLGSMAYVVAYSIGSDLAIAFLCHAMFTTISPQLIALRVLERRAWGKESTPAFLTTINFSDRTKETTGRGSSKADYELEKRKDGGSSMTLSTMQAAENVADYAV